MFSTQNLLLCCARERPRGQRLLLEKKTSFILRTPLFPSNHPNRECESNPCAKTQDQLVRVTCDFIYSALPQSTHLTKHTVAPCFPPFLPTTFRSSPAEVGPSYDA